ncbi:hypothetical protein ABG067_002470 [Albugo candida]
MSREKSRQAAKDLLELCKEEGVKVPTNARNAMVEAGTMLNSTKENGDFSVQNALQEMIKKFGKISPEKSDEQLKTVEESQSKRRLKRKGSSVEEESESIQTQKNGDDSEKQERKKSKPVATCKENQALAEIFGELAGFEFKRGERFKGGTYSKAAKAIRDADEVISSGKQAQKLKGIGKSTGAKIDEFLETGTLSVLEEYRAGNL